MAEGSDGDGRDAAPASASNWLGRELGDDWVEVEPGIFEHRPLRLTDPPPASTPSAWRTLAEEPLALDQELRESLAQRSEETEATRPSE